MQRPRGLGSWLPAPAAFAGTLLILAYNGVEPAAMAKFTAYLVLVIALPGVFVWRLLLAGVHRDEDERPTWFEDVSFGTILGFGLQLPLYLLGVWIGVPLLYLVLPVLALASFVVPAGRGVWALPTRRCDPRVSWTLAVLTLYGVGWLGHYFFRPVPSGVEPTATLSTDGTFHLALMTELEHRVWPQIPFLLGLRLDYHWFVHAQLAANHWLTDIDSVTLLRNLMPTTVLVLGITGLGAVALRLTRRSLGAALAPVLLVVGVFSLTGPHFDAGQYVEPFLSRRFVSSPSQAYGFMMALPAIMLMLEVLRSDRKPSKGTWIALLLTLLALSGSKATFVPIFLCGAVGVWLIHLVRQREVDTKATWLVLMTLGVTLFAQFVILGGSSGGMDFDPFRSVTWALDAERIEVTAVSVVAMSTMMLVAWLLYGVGALGLVRDGTWRDPRALWMLVCVPVGVVVAFFFFRSGVSQFWFQRSVAQLVVLLSVWGLCRLLPAPLTTRAAAPLLGAAAVAGLLAYGTGVLLEADAADEADATLVMVIGTALVPAVVVGMFVAAVAWLKWRPVGRLLPPVVFLMAVLLGLPLSGVYAWSVSTATGEDVVEEEPSEYAPGAVAAGKWVARHSDAYDVVATNVHCRMPMPPDSDRCDNRSFWVAAFTERRVLIEGWGYTRESNQAVSIDQRDAPLPAAYEERLALNDAAFDEPSEETIGRLVDTYDVKFLFVSKLYPVDLPGLESLHGIVRKTFENDNYAVFKVLPT